MQWLEDNVFKDGIRRLRDKSAYTSMRAYFSDKIRTDTMTPAWLPQKQLQGWLNTEYKAEKQKRAAASAAETRAKKSTQNPRPATIAMGPDLRTIAWA